MPGLFESGNGPGMVGQHVNAPTPRPHQVGVTSRRSFRDYSPKNLLMLLQARARQDQNAEESALQAASQAQKAMMQQAMMGQLTPQEQLDAQTFGMAYVGRQREKRQGQAISDQEKRLKAAADEAKAKAKAEERIATEKKKAEAKLSEKKGKADWVTEQITRGRPQMRVPGMEDFLAAGPEKSMYGMEENMKAMSQIMPGLQPAVQGVQQQRQRFESANPMSLYGTFTAEEEKVLRDANAAIPKGWIGQQEFEQRQAQNVQAQTRQSEVLRKQKEDLDEENKKKGVQMNALNGLWIQRTGGDKPLPEEMKKAVAEGGDAYKVFDHFYGKSEEGKRKGSERESSRQDALDALEIKIAQINQSIAEEEAKKGNDDKYSPAKVNALWDEKKILEKQINRKKAGASAAPAASSAKPENSKMLQDAQEALDAAKEAGEAGDVEELQKIVDQLKGQTSLRDEGLREQNGDLIEGSWAQDEPPQEGMGGPGMGGGQGGGAGSEGPMGSVGMEGPRSYHGEMPTREARNRLALRTDEATAKRERERGESEREWSDGEGGREAQRKATNASIRMKTIVDRVDKISRKSPSSRTQEERQYLAYWGKKMGLTADTSGVARRNLG